MQLGDDNLKGEDAKLEFERRLKDTGLENDEKAISNDEEVPVTTRGTGEKARKRTKT